MNRRRMLDYLVYLVVRVFVCLIQSLSMGTCLRIAQGLAFIAARVVRLRGRVIDENLQTAFPELTAAERERLCGAMWEHLLVMVCEIAHAPRKIHRHNWHHYVTIKGKRELVQYLLDPRPTVMVSGHFGNFEFGGFVTGLLGFPSFAVARTLDNPYLDRFVRRFREANGQFILPKQGSSGAIEEVLRSGGLLQVLGDQSAGPKGCWVDFFGKPASYHKAIALFPLVSGAPLLVAYTIRREQPLHFEVGMPGVADPQSLSSELNSVPQLTQWYNDVLEAMIRRTPSQYWWVHRRWKGEPPRRRKPSSSQAA